MIAQMEEKLNFGAQQLDEKEIEKAKVERQYKLKLQKERKR